jgi:hypothetical protein
MSTIKPDLDFSSDPQFLRLKAIKDKAVQAEKNKTTNLNSKSLSIKDKLMARTYASIDVTLGDDLVLKVRARTSNEENQLLREAFASLEKLGQDLTDEEYTANIAKIAKLMYVFVLNEELDMEFWMDPSNWSVDIILRIIKSIAKENDELIRSMDENFREDAAGPTTVGTVQADATLSK